MMFVPEFPERAAYPSTIFFTVASLAAFKEILSNLEKICKSHIKLFNTAATALALFCIFHLGACTYAYYDVHTQYNQMLAYVDANRDAEEIVVPFMSLPSWIKVFVGQRTWTDFIFKYAVLRPEPESHRNIMFAQYYGIKKIRIDENLKWE